MFLYTFLFIIFAFTICRKEDDMKTTGWAIGISVVTVVIVVFGSLVNVVGFQSVKSTINDSPLFNVRTQRATNQQQNNIISKYLGKGMYALTFPLRDNRTEQLKKAIDIISNMDDTTFAQFTEVCIQKARQDNTLRDISRYQIVQTLLLLKTKPESIINSSAISTLFSSCSTLVFVNPKS